MEAAAILQDQIARGPLPQLPLAFETLENLSGLVRDAGLNLDDAEALAWMREQRIVTATMLTRALSVSRPKTTRVMRRLADAGLVREFIDRDDLRKCNYRITNRGANVVFEVGRKIGPLTLDEQLACFMRLRRCKLAAEGCVGALTDTEQRILFALYGLGGWSCVAFVCAFAHVAQPKASMALRALRERGLVESGACEDDSRRRKMMLTASGECAASIMAKSIDASLEQE